MGKLFIVLTLLFGLSAHAEEVNLLKNPGFESRISRWAKTGSSTFGIESSVPIDGDYSANWDASATGEFIRSNLYTIPLGLRSAVCTAEIRYLWDSGVLGEIKLNVSDGTSQIATLDLDPTSGGITQKVFIPFTCPATGALRLELESTADAASIRFDASFLGGGRNNISISQTTFVGSGYFAGTAGCSGWVVTSGTPASFPVDSDCPGPTVDLNPGPGSIQTTDVDLPIFTVNNLPAGNYEIMFVVPVTQSSASNVPVYGVHDGTSLSMTSSTNSASTAYSLTAIAYFSYASSGNRSFELRGGSSAGSTTVLNDISQRQLSFSIKRYPLNSAEAITLETSGASWKGYHDDTCSWSRTSTTVGDPAADASCVLVEEHNVGFGSVVKNASDLPGISFTPKVKGKLFIQAVATFTLSAGHMIGQLTDGSTVIGECITTKAAGNSQSCVFSGIYDAQLSQTDLKIQWAINTGSGTLAEGSALVTQSIKSIEWNIFRIDQQFPTPVFTDLTNTLDGLADGLVNKINGAGDSIQRKVLSARISGAGAVVSQDGSWIASITNPGTGIKTVNITGGTFSAAPRCSVITISTIVTHASLGAATTTAAISVRTYGSTNSPINVEFYITCVGDN